jgi:hypothetical protein
VFASSLLLSSSPRYNEIDGKHSAQAPLAKDIKGIAPKSIIAIQNNQMKSTIV